MNKSIFYLRAHTELVQSAAKATCYVQERYSPADMSQAEPMGLTTFRPTETVMHYVWLQYSEEVEPALKGGWDIQFAMEILRLYDELATHLENGYRAAYRAYKSRNPHVNPLAVAKQSHRSAVEHLAQCVQQATTLTFNALNAS